jgi:hypothetical protein
VGGRESRSADGVGERIFSETINRRERFAGGWERIFSENN